MPDNKIFVQGALAIIVAIGLAMFLYSRGTVSSLEGEDHPGPNLLIDIAGQANGRVELDLLPNVAPQHVQRIVELARTGAYDNVVFHRVIDGFMAQTGDVEYGHSDGEIAQAGQGGSALPDLPAEISDIAFRRGVVGMARKSALDSANSQFFIMLDAADHLNGQYTVVGHVLSGMEIVDQIKTGSIDMNGIVEDPDRMVKVTVKE